MKSPVVFFVIFFACAIRASARIEMASEENEDAAIVDRAELIAVGHLKENSIQYVPHPNTPQEDKNYVELERISRPEITNPSPHPMSWEHQAILVITETIKGNPSGK